jgi:uncharacterized protein (UPF0332 family)
LTALTAADLLARAQRAATSAKLLFDAGDLGGACNRAYYAMFDAARAALLAANAPVKSEVETHSGLIAAFSLHLVKPGIIPAQQGKSLRQVDQIRLVADYSDEEVDSNTAASAIIQADGFVEAIRSYMRESPQFTAIN